MSKLRLASAFVLFLLPVALLLNAAMLWRQLNEARAVSLRDTAARIAAQLEVLAPGELENAADLLAEDTPSLLRLQIHDAAADAPALEGLFTGRELYRLDSSAANVFRAFVPFHSGAETRVAEIDLDPSSTEHLAAGAIRGVAISALSAAALIGLTGFYLWSQRREVRRREEAARLQRLAEIGRMGAVLAHEIRNPLGAVKGFLQLAREQSAAAPRFHLDSALDQLARLEHLVNDLLRFARVPQPRLRAVAWSELVARLRPLVPSASFAPGENSWETDPEMIEQILLNLIRNAEEAVADTPEPEILVQANAAEIEVCDNGPGLSPEIRGRLFEPFATTRARGTGLGLAISRNLAEALGASLLLEDRRPSGTRARLIWRTP
jgi:two-component system sensor histidine kinase HydH